MLNVDLSSFPVDTSIEIDGSTVCLQLMEGGALLVAELGTQSRPASVKSYLELGFSNALEFDAGLALDSVRQSMVLTHWLRDVSNWEGAAKALEMLLNQVDVCRAAGIGKPRQALKESSRKNAERFLRARLAR